MSKITSSLIKDIPVSYVDEDYLCAQLIYDDPACNQEQIIFSVTAVKLLIKSLKAAVKEAKKHGAKRQKMEAHTFLVLLRPDGNLSLEFGADFEPSQLETKIIITRQLADDLGKRIYSVLADAQTGD